VVATLAIQAIVGPLNDVLLDNLVTPDPGMADGAIDYAVTIPT
jgi:hypothetical protein